MTKETTEVELAESDRGWMSGTAGDDVVIIGDPRLKTETQAINDVRDATDLLTRMTDRLRALNGAGLAAPQIGASGQGDRRGGAEDGRLP